MQPGAGAAGSSGTRPRTASCCCRPPRGCIFCSIIQQAGSPTSRLIYSDELVVALPDIKPAAAQHLLILPRRHVPNVSSLNGADAALVRHMLRVGQQLLLQQQAVQVAPNGIQPQPALPQQRSATAGEATAATSGQFKFGFHKPPFRSVDHLHLHCFLLPHKWWRWAQYQSSLNWITADELIDQLARMPSPPPPQRQLEQQQEH